MTPAEHRAAAEQALTDAWDAGDTHTALLRALTHAVLALQEEPECPR